MCSTLTKVCLAISSLLLTAGYSHAAPRADANGDGMVSLAEFQARARDNQAKFDTDKDGKISLSEWSERPAAKKSKRDPQKQFSRLDQNKDGAIDVAEIDRISARRFNMIDSDGDGSLSKQERKASREAGKNAREN